MSSNLTDPQGEQRFLGALLRNAGQLLGDHAMFPEAALSLPAHRGIYEVIRSAWLAGETLHVDTIRTQCLRLDNGATEGPLSTTLKAALKADGYPGSFEDLLQHLRDLYYRRELLASARKLHQRVLDFSTKIDVDALSHVDAVMGLLQNHGETAENAADIAVERVLDLRSRPPGYNPGIPTGFPLLDENACFCPGQVTVVAARPGLGKSSFAQLVALNAGKRDYVGLLCSPEMSKNEIIDRLISQETNLPIHALTTGQLTQQSSWDKVNEGIKRFKNLHIYDTTDMSSRDVILMARRMHARHKLDFIMVDYLQFLNEGEDGTPHRIQIQRGIRRLKALAKSLKIAVLCLAQLNRNVVDKDGIERRPTPADLGDSGAIERDADVIIAIYHTDEVLADGTRVVEFIILKNRNGDKGVEHAMWHPSRTMFVPMVDPESISHDDPEPPRPLDPPPPLPEQLGLAKNTPSVISTTCPICKGYGVIYSDDPEDDGKHIPCPSCGEDVSEAAPH